MCVRVCGGQNQGLPLLEHMLCLSERLLGLCAPAFSFYCKYIDVPPTHTRTHIRTHARTPTRTHPIPCFRWTCLWRRSSLASTCPAVLQGTHAHTRTHAHARARTHTHAHAHASLFQVDMSVAPFLARLYLPCRLAGHELFLDAEDMNAVREWRDAMLKVRACVCVCACVRAWCACV